MKKFFFILITFAFYTGPAFSETGREISSLKTGHFNIIYNTSETPYAIIISDLAEKDYRNIESFLDFTVNEIIDIAVETSAVDTGITASFSHIKISTSEDFEIVKERLYNTLFLLFLNKTAAESESFFFAKSSEGLLEGALCSYSREEFSINRHFILRDYIRNHGKDKINFTDFSTMDRETAYAFYCAFFKFVENSYDMRVLLRAIKDRGFYGGFPFSLSAVTGKTIDVINSDFKSYLNSEISGIQGDGFNGQFLETSDGGSVTDFAVSSDGALLAVLLNNEKKNWIEVIFLNSSNHMKIKLGSRLLYKKILFINDNIAVGGNSKDGSIIEFYDSGKNIKKSEIKLPYIFINSIVFAAEMNKIIINSQYGVTTGLIILDICSGELGKIASVNVYRDSACVCLDGSIYYSSDRDLIFLPDISDKNEVESVVMKLNGKIESVNQAGGGLLISVNSLNNANVYMYSLHGEKKADLISSELPVYKALLSKGVLYVLSLHNGHRRILVKRTALSYN